MALWPSQRTRTIAGSNATWNQRWKTLGWEIRPADVENMRPPGTGLARADVAGDPRAAQLPALQRGATSGSCSSCVSATARFRSRSTRSSSDGTFSARRMRISARRCTVAFATKRRDFPAGHGERFPGRCRNGRWSVAEGEADGLGVSGMWLRPRISWPCRRVGGTQNDHVRPVLRVSRADGRRLERDLVGPGEPDETIEDLPMEKYICGILYPRSEDPFDPAQDDDAATSEDEATFADPPSRWRTKSIRPRPG